MSQVSSVTTIAVPEKIGGRLTLSPGLFRISLAAAVVISHSLPIKFGLAAVYLFFILSGYWVCRLWDSEYRKTTRPYLVFIVSRLWRLLPVYLVSIALLLGFFLISHKALPLPAGSTMHTAHFYFSNLFILGFSRLPGSQMMIQPVWSLDLEMQFYFIAPVLILAMASARAPFIMAIIVALSVISSICFLVFFEGPKVIHGFLPMVLIFFLIGMGAAKRKWAPTNIVVYLSLISAATFMASCLAFHPTRGLFLMGSFTASSSLYNPAASFVLAMLLAPYALATVAVKGRRGFLAGIDRDLSNLTYEVYLLHVVVLDVFANFLAGYSHYRQLPFLVLVYFVIGALSWATYRWIDRPIDGLRRKFIKAMSR
jgi:peptidoglycan/LPS O-acetylase OafA/YrhL